MKVVSIWNPKGGQGKTPLAINIAAAAVDIGLRTLLIDRDLQGAAILYSEGGNLPFEVLSEIPKEAPDVDLVILDHMASDYEIPSTPLLVMPFLPQRDMYVMYLNNYRKAANAGKNIVSVVTNGDLRNKHQRNIVHQVKKEGVYEVKRSGAFGAAAEDYRTLFDKKLNKFYSIDLTRAQISAILTAILKEK